LPGEEKGNPAKKQLCQLRPEKQEHIKSKCLKCQHCANHCEVKRVLIGANRNRSTAVSAIDTKLSGERTLVRSCPIFSKNEKRCSWRYYKENEFDTDSCDRDSPDTHVLRAVSALGNIL